ncbi:penicillin-binding protein 1B [Thiofilum flexile]|uniref:penicillin-binding protein 1B n=1 Tax=Thiofilum flexile TaxID=125627 RepID=UPI0003A150A3|nr:penicillin-binding protein 1B [Thiofilum flexile]
MTQHSTQQPQTIEHQSRQSVWVYGFKGVMWVFSLVSKIFRIGFVAALIIGLLALIVYAMQLDEQVKNQFEGKRWELPARVFARPLELFKGQVLYADHLERELKLLGYRQVEEVAETGQYLRQNNTFDLYSRGFEFADDREAGRHIKLVINKGKISELQEIGKGEVAQMRVEPLLIGNFYPRKNEDRILVHHRDMSPVLLNGLIAVEDRRFYEHKGVNPLAIARAMLANMRAGEAVQGGSTITQQLVKNFYLSNERKLERKLKEALMAVLLELHYSKNEILEAYLNEIHLGQDGGRAIHGFGMAAQFYFNRPIKELKPEQIAMLIGLAKGAIYYNPRKYPERALERRNLVLTVMEQEKVITPEAAAEARARPLGIAALQPSSGASPFPAYLDLVREQLKRDYREEDVRSEGLLIFTSMDPIVQLMAENILIKRVEQLERAGRITKGMLNGVMLISTVQGGEVIALVGGRNVRYPGYNRALMSKRQIGSLVKPAIYLAALENPGKYTLATRINDGPVTVKLGKSKFWEPGNYDKKHMGYVTLFKSLSLSRNTPAVRVGVDVGLERVTQVLKGLGITTPIPQYPSILLGALEMSPMDVQQMYHTIAAGGSYSPLRVIRGVMNEGSGQVLTRYPLTVQQAAKPESVELLTFGMNGVTTVGSARALQSYLPAWKRVAGKTGTTNDKKDSWFAGFSGEHVITVWVGRDDNKETNLTGSTGALKVWGDMMKVLPSNPLRLAQSSRLVWADVDSDTGQRFNPACGTAVRMPFAKGSAPNQTRACDIPIPTVPSGEEDAPQPARPAPATRQAQSAGTRPAQPVTRPAAAQPPVTRPAPVQRPATPPPQPRRPAPAPSEGGWVDELMQ